MTRKELIKKYEEIYSELSKDKELMLRVMLRQFGGVENLWDIVHTHYTGLNDSRDLEDEDLELLVGDVLDAYEEVASSILEEQLELE